MLSELMTEHPVLFCILLSVVWLMFAPEGAGIEYSEEDYW